MRVFAISDLHTDFKENMLVVERLPDDTFTGDALIVAGDVADRLEVIEYTLALLRSKFRQVCYVPGNHELWVRDGAYDSMEKLRRVLETCRRVDVETGPVMMNGLRVVPLLSWYDAAFDGDDDRYAEELEGWADFHFCKWPDGVRDPCRHFLDMNEANIKRPGGPVISFSHFLPRRDLLPPRERLRFKSLPKVSGCAPLDGQIRRLKSTIHVFGHSHINTDRVIEGVRYVNNALRYPRERAGATFPLKMIWDGGGQASAEAHQLRWN
ncbi:MAG TPA: metallophosphoesterase [Pyrinomonadaceae bacterium]|nr:metallophosphoesterase [Pyrinomonadaceae bacterium]